MNRKEFIKSHGAECDNWTWSWSFVNHDAKFVIFGAGDVDTKGNSTVILSEDWRISRRGRVQPAYNQSMRHIDLVANHDYKLLTFPIYYSNESLTNDSNDPVVIERFDPVLSAKNLLKIKSDWFAVDDNAPEEISNLTLHPEGSTKQILINSYERSAAARKACIDYHGLKCKICGFSFGMVYGDLARRIIHVHHIVPLSSIRNDYMVDPVKDLIPICPNCHAVIHSQINPLSVDAVKTMIEKCRNK